MISEVKKQVECPRAGSKAREWEIPWYLWKGQVVHMMAGMRGQWQR